MLLQVRIESEEKAILVSENGLFLTHNDYKNYTDYRDSDLDLDLDWERVSELVS